MKAIFNSSKQSNIFVSVVVLMHNDQRVVKSRVTKIAKMLESIYENFELVLIDNGSTDQTIENITKLLKRIKCIRLIRLLKQYNIETAAFAGLETSIGDYVVIMNLAHDPWNKIPQLIKKTRKNSIVYGITGQKNKKPLRKRIFYWYIRKILKLNIPQNSELFMGLDRRAVNALTKFQNYHHIRLTSSQIGFKTATFPYNQLISLKKEDASIFNEINRAFDIIVTFSRHPLRFISWLGLGASLLNLIYALYILLIFLFKNEVAEGWTTQSTQNMVMMFVVLSSLTVLSEYIGRILEETRGHPQYHIIEELNSKVIISNKSRRNIITNKNRLR